MAKRTRPGQGPVGLGQGLKIHIAPTAQGDQTYMQITSEDGFSVNIVLICTGIVLDDQRLEAGDG